jgi:uncharacterized membrane protein SpoIIM required for sporulation
MIGLLSPGFEVRNQESGHEKINRDVHAELIVPHRFLKSIFLNNMGLNVIIIAGAFSLMAFSMLILMFNAIQIGYLIKGLYDAYGFQIAITLVVPHLIVELVSHLLSLYLAYYLLSQAIIPVIVAGIPLHVAPQKVKYVIKLLFVIAIATFSGAVIEVFITPSLI